MAMANKLKVDLAGSGRSFEVDMTPTTTFKEVLAAGGLTPDGFEALAPGKKRLIGLEERLAPLNLPGTLQVTSRMNVGEGS